MLKMRFLQINEVGVDMKKKKSPIPFCGIFFAAFLVLDYSL
jgi:hypothetical protein